MSKCNYDCFACPHPDCIRGVREHNRVKQLDEAQMSERRQHVKQYHHDYYLAHREVMLARANERYRRIKEAESIHKGQ